MKNTNLIKMAVFGGMALFTVSCETIPKDQCLVTDWTDKGNKDANNGLERSELNDYLEACSKYGVEADRIGYLAGYKRGLTEYCTYDGGLVRAESGKSLTLACSGPMAAKFKRGYEEGARKYCTYDKGFRRGSGGGRSYEAACKADGLNAYRLGFRDGRNRYEYERASKNIAVPDLPQ